MIVRSLEELNQIREECKSMVTKRAAASGFTAIVPIPGTDIAADIGMLMELLPAINRKFGLSEEQIEQLDESTKILVAQIIKKVGSAFVGKVISKELIMQVLKGMAKKIAVRQIVKYIPFAGQVAAAAISFATMKYVGNAHVDECYEVRQQGTFLFCHYCDILLSEVMINGKAGAAIKRQRLLSCSVSRY